MTQDIERPWPRTRRCLDPRVALWVSADPALQGLRGVFEPRTISAYQYGHWRPLVSIDPDGRRVVLVGTASQTASLSGVIGGAVGVRLNVDAGGEVTGFVGVSSKYHAEQAELMALIRSERTIRVKYSSEAYVHGGGVFADSTVSLDPRGFENPDELGTYKYWEETGQQKTFLGIPTGAKKTEEREATLTPAEIIVHELIAHGGECAAEGGAFCRGRPSEIREVLKARGESPDAEASAIKQTNRYRVKHDRPERNKVYPKDTAPNP